MRQSGDAARRAASERVSSYYESELAILLGHVEDALARHRAGEIDVHDVDEIMHQYSKAARELWVCCWSQRAEAVAHLLDMEDDEPVSWWERAAAAATAEQRSVIPDWPGR